MGVPTDQTDAEKDPPGDAEHFQDVRQSLEHLNMGPSPADQSGIIDRSDTVIQTKHEKADAAILLASFPGRYYISFCTVLFSYLDFC